MTTPTAFDVAYCPATNTRTDRRMAGWRENVGGPVAVDRNQAAGPPPDMPVPGRAPAVAVLSWNVWIGRGRLAELVRHIRTGTYASAGITPDLPLVLLIQEAFRSDASVPAGSNGWAPREILGRRAPQEDIIDLADRLGLNLRYAPSMRNGPDRSDRGNAILSSLPLRDARAVELPFLFQRRVAVTATIELDSKAVRLVSAHLDHRGPPDHRWLGAAGRARQAAHLASAVDDDAVVLGADLNLARGRRERTWQVLTDAGFAFGVPPGLPAWRHTFHALPQLVLDYVLVRDRRQAIASAAIHRVDEDRRDRGATVFGSDHHPLLARIELT